MDTNVLKSKFRGSLLGSLLGDCLGSPFEGEPITAGEKIVIQRYFDKLESPDLKGPVRSYTDDTAMMKSIAQSLIAKPEIDYKHMAKLFVKDYFLEPHRGYGPNVVDVFSKLRKSKFDDIYRPAREQFNGKGSFGNGGAMRIAPIALYFYNDYNLMVEAAKKSTEITHTNSLGVHGAVLQCIAIHKALLTDPKEEIKFDQFCPEITKKIKLVEQEDDDGLELDDDHPYEDKVKFVQHFLQTNYHEELDEEVCQNLGTSILAYDSVPTAIYCFLRALKNDIETVKTDNIFRRTIQYAITLGGDTDTIACMAGAIAGAYLGEEAINVNMAKQCESYKEIIELADQLHALVVK
ncbi:hypothetical protein Zmor_000564 [Zophobas morio]|uniref:ADP-ribosylhydrolase ARH3 n=1 Tax=Zophobas morio TaxID=2755281 RepID=A0AA38MRJ7_9CUCU|nr:hypothetical protein Zmor_000564 [Zophobas morio]